VSQRKVKSQLRRRLCNFRLRFTKKNEVKSKLGCRLCKVASELGLHYFLSRISRLFAVKWLELPEALVWPCVLLAVDLVRGLVGDLLQLLGHQALCVWNHQHTVWVCEYFFQLLGNLPSSLVSNLMRYTK